MRNNRRDIIWDVHTLAGTRSGSDSGFAGSGSSSGSTAGLFTGNSSGSTTIVRSGSPICMAHSPMDASGSEPYHRKLVVQRYQGNEAAFLTTQPAILSGLIRAPAQENASAWIPS